MTSSINPSLFYVLDAAGYLMVAMKEGGRQADFFKKSNPNEYEAETEL